MRAVVQRVSRCEVRVSEETVSKMERGLLVLLGVGADDNKEDANWISEKIVGLRIFEDDDKKMSLSVSDIKGSVCVVSQFTLFGDVRKGKRPSFTKAASPEIANMLYMKVSEEIERKGVPVFRGRFRAMMEVELVGDGPVTILLDSKKSF